MSPTTFSENIPFPASQSTIDISTYTRWIIKIKEGPFRGRLPTAVALAAFDVLGKQLGRYGPSEVVWAIKDVEVRIPWAYGALFIEKTDETSLNKSSSNEDINFQRA